MKQREEILTHAIDMVQIDIVKLEIERETAIGDYVRQGRITNAIIYANDLIKEFEEIRND